MSFAALNTPTQLEEAETLPRKDPLVGRVLEGKYEIVSRLGEGGMGTVYRGRRVHIGDEVAIKVLLQKFLSVPTAVERFRREARAAAMLRHPNVVAIYDFAEAAKNGEVPAYIVMELVHGEPLREILQREGRLELHRACSMMRDICAGVGAGHKRDVVHRDIKPDNIIVIPPDEDEDREKMKVVDFGIAKLRDLVGNPTLTQTGMAMGTPYYMSPEQCRGDSLDSRADVYSLAAMLYEMLAGTPPFVARSATGVVAKHLTEAPAPFARDLKVPQSVEAVVMRALSKDANGRPRDALALSRELQTALRQPEPAPSAPVLADTIPEPSADTIKADFTPASPPPEFNKHVSPPVVAPEVTPPFGHQPSVGTSPAIAPLTGSAANYDSALSLAAQSELAPRRGKLWLTVALVGILLAGIIGAWSFGLLSSKDAASSDKAGSAVSKQGTSATEGAAVRGSLLRTVIAQRELFEVAMSPDAQTVVSTGDENKLRVWRVSDGNFIREISGYEQRGRSVAISPDGKVIASGNDDGAIRLWSSTDGSLLNTLLGHSKYVFIVGFSADSQKIVSASADKTLRIWRVSDGAQLGSITVTSPDELIIAVNPDQYLLALLGPDKGVKLWSINNNALLRQLEGHRYDVTSGAFSLDGKVLALGSGDGMVRLWDVASGKLLKSMEGVKGKEAGSVAFSPSGDLVASGADDGSIRIWKVADGSPVVTLEGHKKGVHTLSFSGDGKVLASGSDDKTIKLWRISE